MLQVENLIPIGWDGMPDFMQELRGPATGLGPGQDGGVSNVWHWLSEYKVNLTAETGAEVKLKAKQSKTIWRDIP